MENIFFCPVNCQIRATLINLGQIRIGSSQQLNVILYQKIYLNKQNNCESKGTKQAGVGDGGDGDLLLVSVIGRNAGSSASWSASWSAS